MIDWIKTILGMVGLTAAITMGIVALLHATGPERSSAEPPVQAPVDEHIVATQPIYTVPPVSKPVADLERVEQRLTNLEMRLVAVQGLLNQLVGMGLSLIHI